LRLAEHDCVGVGDEEANAGIAKESVNSVIVGAFGQPDPLWGPAEVLLVIAAPNLYLSAPRFGPSHKRQKAVSRGTRNDLDGARLLQRPEPVDQILAVTVLKQITSGAKVLQIHPGRIVHRIVAPCAADFLLAKLDETRRVAQVSFLQQRIGQHLTERRSQPERYSGPDAISETPFENAQQRNVSLTYCLEQPFFFQEVGILGVTHKGKVRVKD
jgi:hypothetical protein